MEESEKKLKHLASLLKNDDDFAVAEAVRQLREEEPFSGAVGLLAEYYDMNYGTRAAREIENFLNDLHEKSVRPEVIGEIKKKRNPSTTAMLVSSCWQSGMNYTMYAVDIAGVFAESDLTVAIECMTVIENAVPELGEAEKKKITGIIRKGSAGDKKSLALKLISIIEASPLNQQRKSIS